MLKSFSLLLSFILVTSLNVLAQQQTPPKREFRGVWIATVQNIDWPSKPVDSVKVDPVIQRQELVQILDEHQQTGINAVMLQVRPSTDAFYANGPEQWSMFLTGKQGLAPNPIYDPLEFAIEEAHNRGMELHAWFNPYRATTSLVDSLTSQDHITRTHPDWFFTYGGKKYFNPGLPEVRAYIIGVIMHVVRNYDIDGVHFDDYFYPYPGKTPLPDAKTFQEHGQEFNTIADWRRNNVDVLIQTLSDSIHAEKSYVKFGISPFGIWRNKVQDVNGSESNGLSGYSALYANARKWVKEGWIDYVNPQVYFPFYNPAAPYEKLVDWWSANAFDKHVYIGQGVYRAMEDIKGWRDKKQLPDQVRYLRKNPNVQGSVFFSSKSLTNNLAGFQDSLRNDFYQYPALTPQMPWLDNEVPAAPTNLHENVGPIFSFNKKANLEWEQAETSQKENDIHGYVIYRFTQQEKIDLNDPSKIIKISFNPLVTWFQDETITSGTTYRYVITAIDRLKNESIPSNIIEVKTR